MSIPTQSACDVTDASESLTATFDAPNDVARINAWRASGVNDTIVACCAAELMIDRIIDRQTDLRRHIFIACFPESASTYLNRLLLRVTGYSNRMMVTYCEDNVQDIQRERLSAFLNVDSISLQHARATIGSVIVLRRMHVRPIVLLRNIFDVLVSVRDHLANENHIAAPAHVPFQFHHWDRIIQLDFLVHMFTPWLINFYVSWQDASLILPVCWLSYDDLVKDTAGAIERSLSHSRVSIEMGRIIDAVRSFDPFEARFIRGDSGLGQRMLNTKQRQVVREIASLYSESYDLSLIGL